MQLNRIAAAASAACVLSACAMSHRATTVESGGDIAMNAVTPVDNRTIPVGAMLTANLDQTLGTNESKAGDAFSATVASTLYASDGSVVVPGGAMIDGHVTAVQSSGNATQPALIRLSFDRIRMNGQSYPFAANIVQSNAVQTSTDASSDRTKRVVIGGAVGAALGAIVGHDAKDIVIGGAVGAALGSIISLGTEVNATLPAGSEMTLQATQTTVLR